MTVYRAISPEPQALDQRPMGWVRSQPAYSTLATDPDPKVAAALSTAGTPRVAKVWTELAYEAVRSALAPDAPSRLDSIFACADPIEALSFTEATDSPQHVWEGEVDPGVRWAMVDMSAFSVVEPGSHDRSAYQAAWDRALNQAEAYWAPGPVIVQAEILVLGHLQLRRRLLLLPLLLELGLVKLSPNAPA
jgi:hypothetical protein